MSRQKEFVACVVEALWCRMHEMARDTSEIVQRALSPTILGYLRSEVEDWYSDTGIYAQLFTMPMEEACLCTIGYCCSRKKYIDLTVLCHHLMFYLRMKNILPANTRMAGLEDIQSHWGMLPASARPRELIGAPHEVHPFTLVRFVRAYFGWAIWSCHNLPYIGSLQQHGSKPVNLPPPSLQFEMYMDYIAVCVADRGTIGSGDYALLRNASLCAPVKDMPTDDGFSSHPSERLARLLGTEGVRRLYFMYLCAVLKQPYEKALRKLRSMRICVRRYSTQLHKKCSRILKLRGLHDASTLSTVRYNNTNGMYMVVQQGVQGKGPYDMKINYETVVAVYQAMTGGRRDPDPDVDTDGSKEEEDSIDMADESVKSSCHDQLHSLAGGMPIFVVLPESTTCMVYVFIDGYWKTFEYGTLMTLAKSTIVTRFRLELATQRANTSVAGDGGNAYKCFIPCIHDRAFGWGVITQLGLLCSRELHAMLRMFGCTPNVDENDEHAINTLVYLKKLLPPNVSDLDTAMATTQGI